MECTCCCCTETCLAPGDEGYTVEMDWDLHLKYIETKDEWNLAMEEYTPEQRQVVETFAADKVDF